METRYLFVDDDTVESCVLPFLLLGLRLNVSCSPPSLTFSPTPASPVMSEISPQEYLTMANQAYIVAYVTGLVHPTLLRFSTCSSLPSIAVCAATLLYDYALTFGEEVRANTYRPSPSHLTTPVCFRRSQGCGRQLPSNSPSPDQFSLPAASASRYQNPYSYSTDMS